MTPRFRAFVVLADMRTGSNFLESSLNDLPGVESLGEAFNPVFPGFPDRTELLAVTKAQRDADPWLLLRRIIDAPGLKGFRYFHDHDPRVFDHVMTDPGWAKIVLSRNPVDSFVSLKIAGETQQWLLRNVKDRKAVRVTFDPAEFSDYLDRVQGFRQKVQRALQVTGQSAFHIHYDDLGDVDVLNGLAAWLGIDGRLLTPSIAMTRQNPETIEEKVTNFAQMQTALAEMDRFDLSRTPQLEPQRKAAVPHWVAAAHAPLMWLPLRPDSGRRVERWMAALDGVDPSALRRGFSQKTFRQWKRGLPGARLFTVVRHPLARAHSTFCTHLLHPASGSPLARHRDTLIRQFGMALPDTAPDAGWTRRDHRAAFLAFLAFAKANLAGQTPQRVDAVWATQEAIVQGFAQSAVPDMILRENALEQGLAQLAAQIGRIAPAPPKAEPDPGPVTLADIHDPEVESACRAAYGRDYTAFGFADWVPSPT